MRHLFLVILAGLVVFSQFISFRGRKGVQQGSGLPVLIWSGAANPARARQIEVFKEWLKKNHHPAMGVQYDTANASYSKIVIQGVTGVAGDFADTYGNGGLRYLQEIGILQDLSPYLKEFNIDLSNYFQPILEEILIDGKLYGQPCNATVNGYLVNIDAFEKVGLPIPPYRNDLDAFERIGVEFVRRANVKPERLRTFFAGSVSQQPEFESMHRSLGIGLFNETLSASGLNRPEMVALLKRIHRWIYQERLAPTAAELSSVAVEAGFGQTVFQLFNNGHVGLIFTGRWALIQIRNMKNNPRVSAIEPPHGGWPNSVAVTRASVFYEGGKNKDLAKYFFAYLASEEYNRLILADGDSLPPNPAFLKDPDFLSPKGFENEWSLHSNIARLSTEIGVGREYSPYVLAVNCDRRIRNALDRFLSDILSAEDATAEMGRGVDEEIQAFVKRHPERKERYLRALDAQKVIDAIKARGEKIPLDQVENAFLKKYYRATGRGI